MSNKNSDIIEERGIRMQERNIKEMQGKTNKKMLILSCIGIIIVVLGHSADQISLVSNIFKYYSFHMVLFVFISGYFYKPENEDKLWGKEGYILKKIKRLVIPYFMWNLIYGIIVNIFKSLNIISYGEPINFNSLFVKPWITGHQFILNLASWFLLALFIVNILYILIRKIFTKIKLWNDYVAVFVTLMGAITCVYLSKQNLRQEYIPILRTGFFLFFYQFGYIYKTKIENKLRINAALYLFLLIMVQLIILKVDGKISNRVVFMSFDSKMIITPIIVGLTGILFWTKISEILEPSLGNSKVVNYIGNNTFDIMLHHLFCMFLINVIIFKISTLLHLDGFNVERFKTTIYYCYTAGLAQVQILYTFCIITIPLIVRYAYTKLQYKICSRKLKK